MMIRTAFLFCAALLSSVIPAHAEPPPLEAYGDLPGVEDAAISPGGGQVAVVGTVQGKRLLAVYGQDKVRAAFPVEETKVSSVDWIDEDNVLLVTRTTQPLGYGFLQDRFDFNVGIIASLNPQKVDHIFAHNPDIMSTIFGSSGIRNVDGKAAGYFGGVQLGRNSKGEYMFLHGRPALFKVTFPENAIHKVAPAAIEGHFRGWLVDGQGQIGATLDFTFATGNWEIRNSAGEAIAAGNDPAGHVRVSGFGSDGKSVIYSEQDEQTGRARYFEVPLSGGTPKEILAGTNVVGLYLSRTDSRMLGYLVASPRKPVFFDPALNDAANKIYRAFPKLDVLIKDWTPDYSHLLIRTSGNGDSGTWYVVDIRQLQANPIGSDYPLVPPEQVGAISSFEYSAADGMALNGILTLPPGRKAENLPLVVIPHPNPNGRDDVMFDWFAQAFASRGYAVIQPNFRGSSNGNQAFIEAGYGQWGRKIQTDLSDAIGALAQKGIVDPHRACIVGLGFGGYSALAGVTLQHGIYRCAVAIGPISDFQAYFRTNNRESGENKMVKARQRQMLGDPSTYADISPRRFAGQADAPILLMHGKDDTVVEFDQSRMMADALQEAGKQHELILMKKEDHWLSIAETRKQTLKEAVEFVQKYNPAQ